MLAEFEIKDKLDENPGSRFFVVYVDFDKRDRRETPLRETSDITIDFHDTGIS